MGRKFNLSLRLQHPHPSLHLSASCQVAHKASTLCCQTALSAAAMYTALLVFHPALSLSFSAVFLHVVLGLPCLRRPSGIHFNTFLQSLFILCQRFSATNKSFEGFFSCNIASVANKWMAKSTAVWEKSFPMATQMLCISSYSSSTQCGTEQISSEISSSVIWGILTTRC